MCIEQICIRNCLSCWVVVVNCIAVCICVCDITNCYKAVALVSIRNISNDTWECIVAGRSCCTDKVNSLLCITVCCCTIFNKTLNCIEWWACYVAACCEYEAYFCNLAFSCCNISECSCEVCTWDNCKCTNVKWVIICTVSILVETNLTLKWVNDCFCWEWSFSWANNRFCINNFWCSYSWCCKTCWCTWALEILIIWVCLSNRTWRNTNINRCTVFNIITNYEVECKLYCRRVGLKSNQRCQRDTWRECQVKAETELGWHVYLPRDTTSQPCPEARGEARGQSSSGFHKGAAMPLPFFF